MHKKKILILALFFWLIGITTLSLVSMNGVSIDAPKNADKYVHFLFYFILTLLLILNLRFYSKVKFPIVFSFFMAVIYGIIIEILQGQLTENRKPEVTDAIFNSLGSLTAVILVVLNRKRLNFIK